MKKFNRQHHDRRVTELSSSHSRVNYEQFAHERQMVGKVGQTCYVIGDKDNNVLPAVYRNVAICILVSSYHWKKFDIS